MTPVQDLLKETDCNSTKDLQAVEEGCSSRMIPCDDIKNEFLCAICLGILKKAVTSQECLHRFCQECIRTSLQVGNQECPTCRAELTQSHLRADPVFDNLIQKLFPETETPNCQSRERNAIVLEEQERNFHELASNNNNALTENPQRIPEEGYQQISETYPENESKRKRSTDENNAKEEKDLHKSKSLKIAEHVADDNSKTGVIELKSTTEFNEKKTKRVKRPSISKRRSLRIEALKVESEKNKTEVEYNRRLSIGSAQIFFSSLMLRPSNSKTVDDATRCPKEALSKVKGELKDKNLKSYEDSKEHAVTINKEDIKEETNRKKDISVEKDEFAETLSEIALKYKNEDDEKINNTMGTDESQERTMKNSKRPNYVNLPANNVSLNGLVKEHKDITPKIPKKTNKTVLVTSRRSQRSAAIIAQVRIISQTKLR